MVAFTTYILQGNLFAISCPKLSLLSLLLLLLALALLAVLLLSLLSLLLLLLLLLIENAFSQRTRLAANEMHLHVSRIQL